MKIAIVSDAIYPFTIGGSEIRNHEIAKRLVKKGHEVHILGGKFWNGPEILDIDGVKIHGLSPYSNLYDSSGKRNIFESFRLSFNLYSFLIKNDFDIIDNASFVYFNCYTSKLASVINKIPLVFTWHQYFGKYLRGYFGNIKGSLAMALETGSTRLNVQNIAVSENVKKELIKRGLEEEKISLIKNGADIKFINSIKKQNKKYDIIFVGRLNYQKNLKLLVESIALAKMNSLNIKACIVGNGSEKKSLLSLVKNLGLQDNFEFVGEIKDKKKLFEYMKSSRLFVLPSLLEGFPLTLVEANACGLPIITVRTPWNNTLDYILNNGFSGVISEPNKYELYKNIIETLRDKDKIRIMAKNGLNKVRNYDWDHIAEQTERYYLKIISKK